MLLNLLVWLPNKLGMQEIIMTRIKRKIGPAIYLKQATSTVDKMEIDRTSCNKIIWMIYVSRFAMTSLTLTISPYIRRKSPHTIMNTSRHWSETINLKYSQTTPRVNWELMCAYRRYAAVYRRRYKKGSYYRRKSSPFKDFRQSSTTKRGIK